MTLVEDMGTGMENHPMDMPKMNTEVTDDSGELDYYHTGNPLLSGSSSIQKPLPMPTSLLSLASRAPHHHIHNQI